MNEVGQWRRRLRGFSMIFLGIVLNPWLLRAWLPERILEAATSLGIITVLGALLIGTGIVVVAAVRWTHIVAGLGGGTLALVAFLSYGSFSDYLARVADLREELASKTSKQAILTRALDFDRLDETAFSFETGELYHRIHQPIQTLRVAVPEQGLSTRHLRSILWSWSSSGER